MVKLKESLIKRIAIMNEVDLRTELIYIINRIEDNELTKIYPESHPYNSNEQR